MKTRWFAALLFTALAGTAWGDRERHVDFARVVDARPVYESIERRVPEQECWIETLAVDEAHPRSATGTILGGIIGAAVGNELGHKKRNKQVGAVAGAILGASIGRDISHRRQHSRVEYRDVERCETRYRRVRERRLLGYDVTYRYRGELYHTTTDTHPGKRIRVAVDVRPLHDHRRGRGHGRGRGH